MLHRHLAYLVALANEEHFARAAEACNISQPTLSAALRQLEEEFGTAIVERGNRFRGFTPQGEIVLRWARRMLADERSLKEELGAAKGRLIGRLRLGVIPSASSLPPGLTTTFIARHPLVAIEQTEMTSNEILRSLAAFELDAGLTYVDNEPLDHVRAQPVEEERYVLVLPRSSPLASQATIGWREAAEVPLCLLRPTMQNRRIYDAAFATAGVRANVVVEPHSMMGELCYLRSGLASIMPDAMLPWIETIPDVRAIPLVEPEVTKTVGLVVADRPLPALVEAFWDHVRSVVAGRAAAAAAASSTSSIAR
jgi:DNA-binding transcriptional LysR family regulator